MPVSEGEWRKGKNWERKEFWDKVGGIKWDGLLLFGVIRAHTAQ